MWGRLSVWSFLGALVGLGACQAPSRQAHVTVVVRLNRGLKAGDRPSLSEHPMALFARIEAPDLPSPIANLWVGDPGEQASVTLDVPAGGQRSLYVEVFFLDQGELHTYRGVEEGLELTEGDQDVAVDVRPVWTWAVDGTVETSGPLPTAVAPLDAETGVLFPEVPVASDGSFEVQGLPVGGLFYLVFRDESGKLGDVLEGCALSASTQTVVSVTVDLDSRSCSGP